MTTKLIPQAAFPAHIPVPERLQALVEAVNAGMFDPFELGGDFGLDFEPVANKASWFAYPPTPSALYAAEQLAAFGRGGDGSIYAIWKAPTGGFPVVFLDSEGDSQALASNFDQFLQLIAGDDGAEEEESEANPDFQAWVRTQGLEIPHAADDITLAAKLAYPDFSGWCDEAAEGTLSAETAVSVQATTPDSTPAADIAADTDLWTLMLSAIGQRIDSPIVKALVERIGAKPLTPATPRNDASFSVAKPLGMEIAAKCHPLHRAYWPARKEGRIWLTYVTQIVLEPPFPGPLPQGLDWAMSRETLDAVGTREERGVLAIPHWVLTSPRDDLAIEATTSKKRALARLWLNLPQEKDHITASADYEKQKPLVYVEHAFFATWCALNGLLRTDRFTPEVI
jgi:hypothetical protein